MPSRVESREAGAPATTIAFEPQSSRRKSRFPVTSARTTTKRTKLTKKEVKGAATFGVHSNCLNLGRFSLVRLVVHSTGYAANYTSGLSVKCHMR